jgi:ABC-type polar amino acid transport system ATPase subunit
LECEEELMTTVRIDEKEYELDSLSDAAKSELNMLQLTDQEIARLQIRLAIAQTARIAYARALAEALLEDEQAH